MKLSTSALFLAIATLPTVAAFTPTTNDKTIKTALNAWARKVQVDVDPASFIIPDSQGVFLESPGYSAQRRGSRPARSSFAQHQMATPAPVETYVAEPALPEPEAPVAPVPEQIVVEEVKVVATAGKSAGDVSEYDAQVVQHAMDSMRRVCPNFHPDLFGLVFWIQQGNAEEVAVAMEQLNQILEEEKTGQQNTEALYRSGAHVDIVRAMQKNGSNEKMVQTGMEILQKVSSKFRASQLAFNDSISVQASLAAVGATDCAFAAMVGFPENAPLCMYSLSVISNLMGFFNFEEIVKTGLLDGVMAIVKDFEEDSSMLFVACDILFRTSTTKDADLAKFEEMQAVSILAKLMEFYSGKDDKIHSKASQALESILALAKN